MSKIDKLAFDFRHFALRLFERYDMTITFEYYKELSSLPYLKNRKVRVDEDGKPNSVIGFLKIYNKKVMVLKSLRGNKSLRTALPLTHKENKKLEK